MNLSDNRATTLARSRPDQIAILYSSDSPKTILAVNHTQIARPCFINQGLGPVSLEIKDTEVRTYRTDPVQVRS
uniref:Uncharacterized protein n=1 Tax=Brassica oleracea var. oleracea TaxID=109376 RepID=A0A0D3DFB1_BRAOL